MVFIIKNRIKGFKVCQIWFADKPVDVNGFDRVMYYWPKSKPDDKSFRETASYLPMVNLEHPLEDIFKGFNDTTRYEVRKAEKEAIKYKMNSDYEEFLNIFNSFIKEKKLNLPNMTKEIILQQNHLLFNAYKDDKLLVSHFYLVEENMLFLVFSTSILPKIQDKKDEQAISMSSRYLHYQAMKYGKESGYKNLCFGSIGNDPDSQEGRVKFKLGFGGEIIKKDFYTKDYSYLLKFLSLIVK